jgi:gamma-glutamyltranspeptidase / glutathione hydrolase
MPSLKAVILGAALVAVAVAPSPAASRPATAAPTTPYDLSAVALLGPVGTDVDLTVTSATAPIPDHLEKVQVKVWPVGEGDVETHNFFDVAAPGGKATLQNLPGIVRMQRVQVRALVKNGSQNVLEAETVGQYRALGAISSDHPRATEAGTVIFKAGGNAFDAAAAVLFALNVTQPALAGIGGSANIVVHSAVDGRDYAIDARERAPAATTADIFKGRNVGDVSVNGFSVGVPGTLRAIEAMLDRWGTMPLAQTLQPAIDLAAKGFTVGSFLAQDLLDSRVARFQPETKAIFLPGGIALKAGDRLVQPQLAETLRLIAREGPSVFYRGEIASAIVDAQQRHSIPGGEGRMTLADLAAYDVVVRPASHLDYRGYDVFSAAPSSHGGQVLLEALGLLEDPRFPIGNVEAGYGFGTRFTIHVMAEALRLALADREWVGDPAFFPVPESQLLSDAYLRARSALMSPFPTRMPPDVKPGNPLAFSAEPDEEVEAGHTTHFSVIDRYGNVVSFTTTLADSFGSGITVPGYGFVLNDSLRLFNFTPRGPNDAGPNKRPAGSMTPTVILKGGEPFVGTGTYGSLFIPSLVLNVVLDVIDHHLPLQQAVNSSRIWMSSSTGPNNFGVFAWNRGRPGGLVFAASEIDALRAIGPPPPNRFPALNPPPRDDIFGSLASVGVEPGTLALVGAADARLADATATVVSR